MADLRAAELGWPWRICARQSSAGHGRSARCRIRLPLSGRRASAAAGRRAAARSGGAGQDGARSAAAGQRRRRRRGAPWVPVCGKISLVRRALDQPLNYTRIYLADLLPRSVPRVLYLDSDILVLAGGGPRRAAPEARPALGNAEAKAEAGPRRADGRLAARVRRAAGAGERGRRDAEQLGASERRWRDCARGSRRGTRGGQQPRWIGRGGPRRRSTLVRGVLDLK